jgi:hypothetical protein
MEKSASTLKLWLGRSIAFFPVIASMGIPPHVSDIIRRAFGREESI